VSVEGFGVVDFEVLGAIAPIGGEGMVDKMGALISPTD